MSPRIALLVLALALSGAQAHAQEPDRSASAEDKADAPVEVPLPELPKLQPVAYPPPKSEAIQELETRLDELLNTAIDDPLDELDAKVLGDLDPSLVPAIRQRLEELREDLDGKRARKLLERARKSGRKAIRAYAKDNDLKKADHPEGDWLVFMMSLGDSDDDTWRRAVELYAMNRMLESIGTTPAVRQMVATFSYFGELVRIDLRRAMTRLKDKAVPALMEAKDHDARKVRRWARGELDGLGKAIPGEAVSTTDPDILADVLRAFGRTRNVDATRVVMSFANSDRVQLRRAAREAVSAIGKPAWGHYKDIYKNLTGEKPPRDWDWERTLRELFRLHDSARLATVYQTWEQGKKAAVEKRWAAATEAYDKVLARAPLFEERNHMAPAYLARAKELIADGKIEPATIALRKALRLGPDDASKKLIESRLAMLEGKALIEAGTPDRHILKRALELDPGNEEAQRLLSSLELEAEKRQSSGKRYIAAASIGVVAVVLLLLLWRRPRRKETEADAD